MTSPVPTITLNNGVEMPLLGFGVFQVPAEETEEAVLNALEVGYRSIDTAAIYNNEKAVGKAIAASGIPREELFITTKLWISDAGEKTGIDAFERSCEKLGIETLDLYLIHQPFGDTHGAWRALEHLLEEGRTRAIGVSNFHIDRIQDLIETNTIVPAVNQIEYHPFYQRTADREFLTSRGIVTEAWSPFAQGVNGLFTHPLLNEIAATHERTVAQIVLRWLVQQDVIVIPKSVHRERMAENFDIFTFELSDDEIATIGELDAGVPIFLDHHSPDLATFLHSRRPE
ncbi:MAG: aldo/keto reductase [Actinomycetaceae bacterium]|nr:aldo/keto reductase [Actinomycetaceae bacterium]